MKNIYTILFLFILVFIIQDTQSKFFIVWKCMYSAIQRRYFNLCHIKILAKDLLSLILYVLDTDTDTCMQYVCMYVHKILVIAKKAVVKAFSSE
jgi:hypothetical protein